MSCNSRCYTAVLFLLISFYVVNAFQPSLSFHVRYNAASKSRENPLNARKAVLSVSKIPVDFEPAIYRLRQFASSVPYSALETIIVLTLISLIDGGFSGDWSKYRLISTQTEFYIRELVISVGVFHLVCAPTAGVIAKQKNHPVAPAFMRTLLIGGLSLFRVLLQTDTTAARFPEPSFAGFKQFLAATVAGEYDATVVQRDIQDLLVSNPCVMFSFTTCPFCLKAKALLIDELQVPVQVVELDVDRERGYPIRAELGKLTGRTSVPSIWIGGTFVGGCNDGPKVLDGSGIATAGGVVSLQREGQLTQLLRDAGAFRSLTPATGSENPSSFGSSIGRTIVGTTSSLGRRAWSLVTRLRRKKTE